MSHMYITVPFKGGFPTKRIRGTVMRALDELNGHGPGPGPDKNKKRRTTPAQAKPLRPVALASYAHTRWEDIRPDLLVHAVCWYVAMRVDAGSSEWYKAEQEPDRGCSLRRLTACHSKFEALMAAASASTSLTAHVDVANIRIMSCVDLTSRFKYLEDEDIIDGEDFGSEDEGASAAASAAAESLPKTECFDDSETDARIFKHTYDDSDLESESESDGSDGGS